MTPEEQKKIWGRKVKGPKHGRWVEEVRPGNLVWKRWPRKRKAKIELVVLEPTVTDTRELQEA